MAKLLTTERAMELIKGGIQQAVMDFAKIKDIPVEGVILSRVCAEGALRALAREALLVEKDIHAEVAAENQRAAESVI